MIGRDRRVDGETVIVVEAARIGPRGERLLTSLHEFLLKAGYGVHSVGVTGGYDTTLAGIMAHELNLADEERPQFARCAVKPVFAEGRFVSVDLEIRSEAVPHAFKGEAGIP